MKQTGENNELTMTSSSFGYDGDVEEDSEDNEYDTCSWDEKDGFYQQPQCFFGSCAISAAQMKKNRRYRQKPRSRRSSSPSTTLLPCHPDIDRSVVKRMTSHEYEREFWPLITPQAQSQKQDDRLDEFAYTKRCNFLANCFRTNTAEGAMSTCEPQVCKESVPQLSDSTDTTRKRSFFSANSQPSIANSLTDFIKGSSMTLSSDAYTLEEALGFSTIPRLLVQATSPYAVVHANAAYSNFEQMRNDKQDGLAEERVVSAEEYEFASTSDSTLQTPSHNFKTTDVSPSASKLDDKEWTVHPVRSEDVGENMHSHYLVELAQANKRLKVATRDGQHSPHQQVIG